MFPSPKSARIALLTTIFISAHWITSAQTTQAPGVVPAPTPFSVANLRPALANVQIAIGSLNIARWKVPNANRSAVQQDVVSMQRDLTITLPELMVQAEAAGANGSALSPTFAVFRNLDALYDVLLRVTETAALAGSGPDSSSLEDARSGLEDGRAKLGAWLAQAIETKDAQLAHAQTPASREPSAPPVPAKIVVNDGPDNTKPHKRKPPAPQAPQ